MPEFDILVIGYVPEQTWTKRPSNNMARCRLIFPKYCCIINKEKMSFHVQRRYSTLNEG